MHSVFPGKTTIPAGCLWSYRVWLRVNFVDHRIFGDDELWVGKDPDFSSIADASFARLKTVNANSQLYDGVVGRARVQFIASTVPMSSMPAGASHRIRVWLKTFLPFPNDQSSNISLPFNDSYVYQRIWKSDSLKIGARLDFYSLGAKMVMGYSNGPPKTFTVSQTRDKYEAKGSIELG
ncbi:hypothetical protein HHX47_DHR5000568 [Lentinula edodes]|nr:hypothetical protein HHX47_DHR5000568 [Lentinula edodes]